MTRTRRSAVARWLTAALGLAVTATLLVSAPAQAGWTDSGPGSTGDSSSSSGSQGSGAFHCGHWISGANPGALYYRLNGVWYRWWEHGYQPCVGQGTSSVWHNTGYAELVPSGYLVYRFYGTPKNPTAAVTRSRTNLVQWGAQESTYAFPAFNPMDAGVSVGSPWAATIGLNLQQSNNWSPESVYLRNDANLLVPTFPTRIQGLCSNLQSSEGLATWFNKLSPEQQIGVRASFGTAYWKASGQGRFPHTGRAEAGIGQIRSGYRFLWRDWQKDTSKAPSYNANGDSYYLADFTWETRACASPLQFTSEADTPRVDRTVVGTCYAPLMRKRTQVRHIHTGQYSWKWPTVQHDWNRYGYGDGERISTFYQGTAYTPRGAGGDTLDRDITGLTGAQQSSMIQQWRYAMAADYRAWASGGYTTSSGAQVVPANPYAFETGGSFAASTRNDIEAGAQALVQGARCRVGTSSTFDAAESPGPDPVNATVNLKVTNQRVLQVSPTEAKITVVADPMLCDGRGCEDNVTLSALSWSTAVAGTNGYKLCQATSSSMSIANGCDGVYRVQTFTNGPVQRSQTITVRFAHPTDPSEAVRVSLTNLRGQHTQQVETGGIQIRGVNPITGDKYTVDTGPLRSSVIGDLAEVTAAGTPAPLTTVSGGYRLDLPVLGAVQVPVSRR